jgi:hypothetical protein
MVVSMNIAQQYKRGALKRKGASAAEPSEPAEALITS